MGRNNEGIVRLVRELVDQLESYQTNVLEPLSENQPYDTGDDIYDISLSCRKAKKLLAIHDREESFEKECVVAFKRIKQQREKFGLNPLNKGGISRGANVEELSEFMVLTDNLANLLRKALWNWRELRDR